jgi:beta-aspartyl-peptidase (threonine type)
MRVPRFVVVSLLVLTPVLPALLAAGPADFPPVSSPGKTEVVLAIHGGEGDVDEKTPQPEQMQIRAKLEEALKKGYEAMQLKGGTSLDGVEAAIRVMEESGLFDAGLGSVLDHDGHASLDASIMRGDDHRAGAVADVTIVKHPISAARAVMEYSDHVLIVGPGADRFARRFLAKEDIVPPDDFVNKRNWAEVQKVWKKKTRRTEPQASGGPAVGRRRYGTVGAVALWNKVLAAGTSTGGLTDKLPGRVGDSPIIGAGTYADNATCAVSCTGIGEYFIRYTVAHDVSARMKYQQKVSAREAAHDVIQELRKVKTEEKYDVPGVEGGLIVLDHEGNFSVHYNATQMTRGYIKADGEPHVTLFENDKK